MRICSRSIKINSQRTSPRITPFGAVHGRCVVYFHGVPGAPDECRIFDHAGKTRGLRFICVDRFSVDASIEGEAYYQFLADEISKEAAGQPVDVVGFSIGAFVAMQTCRYLPDSVKSLHLVSVAAPLDAGHFLDTMAGKQVFTMAKNFPAAFWLLSVWQGLMARLAPGLLFRLLFASAAGDDKALVNNREFQLVTTRDLKACFVGRVRGYMRDVHAYVRPWNTAPSAVTIETHDWHGAKDNWSPVEMAHYLARTIPGAASIKIFDGASHYSCLYRAAPEICARLSEK